MFTRDGRGVRGHFSGTASALGATSMAPAASGPTDKFATPEEIVAALPALPSRRGLRVLARAPWFDGLAVLDNELLGRYVDSAGNLLGMEFPKWVTESWDWRTRCAVIDGYLARPRGISPVEARVRFVEAIMKRLALVKVELRIPEEYDFDV